MSDQNQQQNQQHDAQNQGTQQNQNTDNNFDMFGGDYDVLENPDLIQQIDDSGKKEYNDNFDDDIDVDYRDQNDFDNNIDSVQDTEPEIVESQPHNDLGDSDFDIMDTHQENTIGDDISVYDEPDNPNDYVSPDDIYDSINLDDDGKSPDYDDFDPIPDTYNTIDGTVTEDIVNSHGNKNINNNNQEIQDTTIDHPHNTGDIPDYQDFDDDFDVNIPDSDDTISGEKNIGDDYVNNIDEDAVSNVTDQGNGAGESLNYQDIDDDFDVDIPDPDDTISGEKNSNISSGTEDNDNGEIGQLDSSVDLDEKVSDAKSLHTPQTYEIDGGKSNLQNKFGELQFETNKIFQLVNKDLSKGFDLLGANDDRQKIIYTLFISENTINIRKSITDKTNNTNIEQFLMFKYENNSLDIYVNNELLFREVPELQNDDNKNKQVIEKLNKFIFLVTEEYKKISKERQAKEKDNEKKATFREF